MARRKDTNWSIGEGSVTTSDAQLAVLMDIRDELKRLNNTLHCTNFLSLPYKVDRIRIAVERRRRRLSKLHNRKS